MEKEQNEQELLRSVALQNAQSILVARQQAEAALRESEERFRALADSSPVLIWVNGMDGCEFVNRAYVEFLGVTPADVRNYEWAQYVHPEDREGYVNTYLVAFARREPFAAQFRFRRADGQYRWMKSAGRPRFSESGEFQGYTGSTFDITDVKEAEKANARLAAIVESSDDAIVSKDLNGIIVSWNRGAERLFGYTAEEAIGQPITMLIPPERLDEEPGILERIRRGERIEHYETVRRRKDGVLLDISLTVSPIIDTRGLIVGASKIARDITERKKTEQKLRSLMQDLEMRVAERTQELQNANMLLLRDMEERKRLHEQLLQAQKMESIGTLAGGIAHDFNNILNIIQGYTFILRGHGAQTRELSESLAVIDETVQRGSALVQQLLTLARKTEVKRGAVDANGLIEELIALIKQTFPKTIELSSDLARDLPMITGDGNQFGQALLNLCVNARDAMPNGGRLTFRTQSVDGATMQGLGETVDGRYVCIEVSDTGVGMDESIRRRIFEPFFTTKGAGRGTGLGLSVVYGIIKNHSGFIDVESKPMSGTSFRLYFPIALSEISTEQAVATRDTEIMTTPNGKATVLLVEDEEHMLDLLEKILSKQGYRVLKASDGETAIKTYQRHKETIDVVLLDVGLPKMAGRDVLLKIKNENPEVKIVVVSGYLEPELKSEIDRAGVKYFLQKPYLPNELIKIFQSVIERESSHT